MSDGIVIRDGEIEDLTEAVVKQAESISELARIVNLLSREAARQREQIAALTAEGEVSTSE